MATDVCSFFIYIILGRHIGSLIRMSPQILYHLKCQILMDLY